MRPRTSAPRHCAPEPRRTTSRCPLTDQYFDRLVESLEATRADVEKAEAGNKAATSRVRKSMQDVKNLAQELRKEMLELRDSGGRQG